MPTADDIYIHCDELDNIPPICKKNWEFEISLLATKLKPNAKVLQVGCMDGTRIIALLNTRPDLDITGLDIEQSMVDSCNANLEKVGKKATVILGDITKPVPVSDFDYVICLNNTLGYIPDQEASLKNMKNLGEKVIISVFGEGFDDEISKSYFTSIGLTVQSIDGDMFVMDDFVNVLRYSKDVVDNWDGKITYTPLGYFCEIG
ncbi:class I SAM-dependent methyltransferase [Candidatus Peribacteria bacterium]|jgi:SAM-dependent methyltransferase|nr:class I SAM-dependent methyltransferase [Candidatus Peribacteria bacterium]MBT4021061.1 class I SAM-dependent methyltransferase [Candidatus Peribacteria bacterium]MBT4240782.1 class I SAM-dependent methyltransferase [Candidatus Peribacteria bacterium]MBT4474189.1 class I SAM-dependent methyltransferase [Candidatus Peribacteria bacterium]